MRPGLVLQAFGAPVDVRVNSGVECVLAGGVPRVFPRREWRRPTADEEAVLFARQTVPLPDAVTVVALPDAVRARFWDEVAPIVCDARPSSAPERQQTLHRYAQFLAGQLGAGTPLRVRRVRSCDVQVTPPGSRSTAYDYRNDVFVGLHIDNHDRLPLSRRRGAFQVLGLNVGPTSRSLQFVNLPVPDLLEAVGECPFPRDLAARFLAAHPRYPVVRVVLAPGQAYVLVTQYVIHDGATNDEGRPDVAVLLAGEFELVGG